MAVVSPPPTPWGPGGAVALCLLPLVFLVVVTVVKKLLLPTSISLPISAVMLAFIRMAYLGTPSNFVMACMVSGLFEALTPLSIVTGAIMLFQTMHHTKCLPWIMAQIKGLSAGHPVAEVFLIGFCFAYLVEGASGFGTPVALSAPMLSSLGHAPIPSVACLLIMNTLATQFGAVGTPIWFGFGDLGLGDNNLELVGRKAAIVVGLSAYVIAPLAASMLVPFKVQLRSALFVFLSITSAVAPSIGIAFFSYEFPTLIGGLVSLALTGLLVKFRVGLAPMPEPTSGVKDLASSSTSSKPVAAAADKQDGSMHGDFVDGAVGARSGSKRSVLSNANIPIEGSFSVGASRPPLDLEQPPRPLSRDDSAECADTLPSGGRYASNGNVPARRLRRMRSMTSRVESEYNIALDQDEVEENAFQEVRPPVTCKDLILRTLPLWVTILVLLVTRIQQIGLKGILQSQTPSFTWYLGTFGNFGISASLVVQLKRILMEPLINWKYEILYIPFLLPFVAASLVTLLVHRKDLEVHWTVPIREAFQRIAGVTVANLGALMLVGLIRNGVGNSPAYYIGYYLSQWMQGGFLAISAFLGALGSFFSGSTTVSNLTFGDIQRIAAQQIGVPITGMLAIQTAGATLGNMVCIANILGAKAVMNLTHIGEGVFIAKTAPVALLMTAITTALGLVFTLGGAMPDVRITGEDGPGWAAPE